MPTQYTIKLSHGAYAVKGPKNERIKAAIKDLAPGLRRWDGDAFVWLIKPEAIKSVVQTILDTGYTCSPIPPLDPQAISATIKKQFTVEYLGMAKDRGQGIKTALGSVRGYWSIEFPEKPLRDWFDSNKINPLMSGQTHYQTLCVFENASDADIKSAHRRLARQWHPDVCNEDGAADKFREIQKAFEVLRDNRKRYDAGLYFERETQKRPDADLNMTRGFRGRTRKFVDDNYRPPLRCGLITVEGVQTFNKFLVSKIVAWDDITDGAGRVMVSSWNKNLGVFDPATGHRKGGIEIRWI